MHDFKIPELGRASPYGVYDIGDNRDWVSVGMDHDTASFAVNAIRRWWRTMGKDRYPDSKILLINADGGGSNGVRLRLWKYELQNLADELDLTITVCHLPPGTSKWNKIEHRLFSFITRTGADDHWSPIRPSSNSSRQQPPRKSSRSKPSSTPTTIPPASRSPTSK